MAKITKSKRRRGAEVLEFTFAFLPLMLMIIVLLDASWAIFVKSTLAFAVRSGVRLGITITGTQATAAGSDLTSMVKANVQSNSLGLLSGATGLAKIKVNYLQPPAPGSTSAAVDVSGHSGGNTPLNIMQVSIPGYSLKPLIPRFFSWKTAIDNSAT